MGRCGRHFAYNYLRICMCASRVRYTLGLEKRAAPHSLSHTSIPTFTSQWSSPSSQHLSQIKNVSSKTAVFTSSTKSTRFESTYTHRGCRRRMAHALRVRRGDRDRPRGSKQAIGNEITGSLPERAGAVSSRSFHRIRSRAFERASLGPLHRRRGKLVSS